MGQARAQARPPVGSGLDPTSYTGEEMFNNIVIMILFVAGIVVQILGFFGLPHASADIVAMLWAWPTGWAAGGAFARLEEAYQVARRAPYR